jgi:hypothetical protein
VQDPAPASTGAFAMINETQKNQTMEIEKTATTALDCLRFVIYDVSATINTSDMGAAVYY